MTTERKSRSRKASQVEAVAATIQPAAKGVSLAKLRSRATRTATLQLGGEVVRLDYQPSRFTPALQKRLEAVAAEPGGEGLVKLETLAAVLTGWNLEDEAGKPLPVTAEQLAELDYEFHALAVDAIVRDLVPQAEQAA
ncbi:MAG: hypothetical protein ACK47B_09175 [Armatimonadota bacterium]